MPETTQIQVEYAALPEIGHGSGTSPAAFAKLKELQKESV